MPLQPVHLLHVGDEDEVVVRDHAAVVAVDHPEQNLELHLRVVLEHHDAREAHVRVEVPVVQVERRHCAHVDRRPALALLAALRLRRERREARRRRARRQAVVALLAEGARGEHLKRRQSGVGEAAIGRVG